jgi:hypothetical protein
MGCNLSWAQGAAVGLSAVDQSTQEAQDDKAKVGVGRTRPLLVWFRFAGLY